MLCVSPLVSLMIDQRDKFNHMAEYIGELHEPTILANVKEELLFVSPESLMGNSLWREVLSSKLYKQSLVAFAVDEAHCIKYW